MLLLLLSSLLLTRLLTPALDASAAMLLPQHDITPLVAARHAADVADMFDADAMLRIDMIISIC